MNRFFHIIILRSFIITAVDAHVKLIYRNNHYNHRFGVLCADEGFEKMLNNGERCFGFTACFFVCLFFSLCVFLVVKHLCCLFELLILDQTQLFEINCFVCDITQQIKGVFLSYSQEQRGICSTHAISRLL
jgi:hypothetical protein